MPTFDPSAPTPAGEGESTVNDNIPSGDYLIRIVWFNRKVSQAKKEYRRVKFEILAGEFTNNAFFSNLSSAVETGGVATRWKHLCSALNITESFEVAGVEGDKAFNKLFMGKPFKARIQRSESGGYVNFDIKSTYTVDTWSDAEREAVKSLLESEPADTADPDDDVPF